MCEALANLCIGLALMSLLPQAWDVSIIVLSAQLCCGQHPARKLLGVGETQKAREIIVMLARGVHWEIYIKHHLQA